MKIQLSQNYKIKIATYVGNQYAQYFKNYKDTAIKKAIQKYISLSSKDEKLDKAYLEFVSKVLLMHDGKAFELLSSLDKVFLNLYVEFYSKVGEHFVKEDLVKFSITPEVTPKSKSKMFLELNSEIQDDKEEADKVVHDPQVVLDAAKKNLDYINGKTKSLLSYYEKASTIIDRNEMLKSLREGIKEIEKNVVDNTKKTSGRMELISTLIKIEQRKASVKDVVNVVDIITKELGITVFKKEIDVAKNLAAVKDSYDKLKGGLDSAKSIAELLLISANLASLSPNPLHKTISAALKFTGEQINSSKAIQNIINERVEYSVTSFVKTVEKRDLPFSAQFYSDFALDAFEIHGANYKYGLKDVIEEKITPISDAIDGAKVIVTNVARDVGEDYNKSTDQGRISKYAQIDDFANDTFFERISEEVEKIAEKEEKQDPDTSPSEISPADIEEASYGSHDQFSKKRKLKK